MNHTQQVKKNLDLINTSLLHSFLFLLDMLVELKQICRQLLTDGKYLIKVYLG